MKEFFEERRPHNGLTYEEYLAEWREEVSKPLEDLDKEERKYAHYARYNYDRSEHVHDAFEAPEALQQALAAIEAPQLWMVLTENWCGDSAYNLPVLQEAAQLSDQVQLRILYRDENPDIMDQYLTGTSRSIPKLIAFDAEGGEELFHWGPRPQEAQQRREELLSEGAHKERIIENVLAWYEEGGWNQVSQELAEALKDRKEN